MKEYKKPEIEIVKFEISLAADAAEVEKASFSQPWSEQSLALPATGEYGCGMACEVDGKLAAYACMVSVLDEGEIVNVATHPDYRRRGYARAVLLALLEKARQDGIVTLTLEVRESNAAAQALYASLGFGVVGKRKDFYSRPREDAIIMLRTEGN